MDPYQSPRLSRITCSNSLRPYTKPATTGINGIRRYLCYSAQTALNIRLSAVGEGCCSTRILLTLSFLTAALLLAPCVPLHSSCQLLPCPGRMPHKGTHPDL